MALYSKSLDLKSNNYYEVKLYILPFYLRAFVYILVSPFTNDNTFYTSSQKYWDKFTYVCIKVVKSEIFGPIFIAHNGYIKLVTKQISWMHLLFVLVVFQMTLCPKEIHGKRVGSF